MSIQNRQSIHGHDRVGRALAMTRLTSPRARATRLGANDKCPCGSGKKFKKCHRGNWPPRAYRQGSHVTDLIDPISFFDFARSLEKEPEHPVALAMSVTQRLKQIVGEMDSYTDDGIHARDAGSIVLAAFYRSDVAPFESAQVEILDENNADIFLKRVKGRLSYRVGDTHKQPLLLLLQIMLTQGALGGQHAYQLFRTLYLLELTDGRRSSPYDSLFEHAYGCSAAEYVALLFMIWVVTLDRSGGYFDVDVVIRRFREPARIGSAFRKICADLACSTSRVKEAIDREFGHHGLDGLVAAFFSRYPLLEFAPGRYLPGPHPYIRLSTFIAPMLRTLDLARIASGKPDPQESQDMGKRFEALLHWILSHAYAPSRFEHEHEVTKGWLSPDLFLFERDDRVVTIFQAKLKRLSRDAFFGFSANAFTNDLKISLAKSIGATVRYLAHIETAKPRSLTDDGRRVAERVRRTEKFMLVGVLTAMPSLFHLKPLRQLLQQAIDDDLKDAERKWLEQNRDRFVGWHVVESEEIADFVAWAPGDEFFASLSEYLALPDLEQPLQDGQFVASFRSYVAERGRRLGRHPSFRRVEEAKDEFAAWVIPSIVAN